MSNDDAVDSDPWGQNGLPAREEWDFSKVPESEHFGCCVWEYARESKTLREFRTVWAAYQMKFLADAYRRNAAPHANLRDDYPHIWEIAKHLSDLKFQPLLLARAGSVPWQSLPETDKSATAYGRFEPLYLSKASVFGKVLLEIDDRSFMATIDWAASDEQIKNALGRFLKINRPPEFPDQPKKKGRPQGTIRYTRALNALGAMRLMHTLPLQSPIFPREFFGGGDKPHHYREEAPSYLRRIFPFIPEDEFPRHFPLFGP